MDFLTKQLLQFESMTLLKVLFDPNACKRLCFELFCILNKRKIGCIEFTHWSGRIIRNISSRQFSFHSTRKCSDDELQMILNQTYVINHLLEIDIKLIGCSQFRETGFRALIDFLSVHKYVERLELDLRGCEHEMLKKYDADLKESLSKYSFLKEVTIRCDYYMIRRVSQLKKWIKIRS